MTKTIDTSDSAARTISKCRAVPATREGEKKGDSRRAFDGDFAPRVTSMFTSIRNLIAAAAIVVASLTFSSRPVLAQQTPPAFSQIILFGDSLSDTGNVNHRIEDITGGQIRYPTGSSNYRTA